MTKGGRQVFFVNGRVLVNVMPDAGKHGTVTEVEEVDTGVVKGQTVTVKLDSGETRIYTNHQIEHS